MKGILRRPLAVCCGVFLLLLFLMERHSNTLLLPISLVALICALLALLIAMIPSKSLPRLRKGLLFAGGLLLSIALACFSAWRVDSERLTEAIRPYEDRVIQAEVTVTEIESASTYSTTLLCTLHATEGQNLSLNGRLTLPFAASLRVGDKIALPLRLHLLHPEGELADCYDLSQGISFEAEGSRDSYRLLSRDNAPLLALREKIRTALRRQFYPYLSDDDCGLVTALLTGDRSGLSYDLREQFQNLGISHTLAVSGLHLGILFGSLLWIFKKLSLPRVLHLPLLLPLLLFYGMLVGSLSVLRAGGMLLFLFAAYPLGRLRDSLTSLFVTVTAICLVSPRSILDIGLLLSFFATWGILLVAGSLLPRLAALPRIPRAVLTALSVTGAATLFTLPFSVWYFGEWAILSPLSNLLLVPLITVLLYLTPILLLFSPIPPLATVPAFLIRGISSLTCRIAATAGEIDGILLPLSYPTVEHLALFCLLEVILLCFFRKTRPLTLAVAVLFLSFSGGYSLYHAHELLEQQTILPYSDEAGENRCLLVNAGTRILLIDCSQGSYSFLSHAIEAGESDPLLRVDALLLTEYHYTQIASYTRLLENRSIEFLLLPTPTDAEQGIAHILAERAATAGCTIRYYSAEESCIGYHGYEIQLFFPSEGEPNSISVAAEGRQLICTAKGELSASNGVCPEWNQAFPLPTA